MLDLLGLGVIATLLAGYETTWTVAILPIAMLLQYAVSLVYHWLPQNTVRQNADHVMIAFLIAATFVPFWGTLLPPAEILWRVPVLAGLAGAACVFRCSSHLVLRKFSVGLYPILASFGLGVSFGELQIWLPPLAFWVFWLGVALYFAQFVVWMGRRPDPYPGLFGFREIQHAVLLCATALHALVVLKFL